MTIYLFSILLLLVGAAWLLTRTHSATADGRLNTHGPVTEEIRSWLLRSQARHDLHRVVRDADPRVQAELLAAAQRDY